MNELEQRLFELLEEMRADEVKRAEKEERPYYVHGLCAVLGYDPEQHYHSFNIRGLDVDVGKDFFENKEIYLNDPEALGALREAMKIDGAILISKDGRIRHSGKYLLPGDIGKVYLSNEEALITYKHLQRISDAGTRHIAAIALSAQQPDLLLYTLKSDRPELRVFRGGRIVRSTVPGEIEQLQESYKGTVPKVPEHKAETAGSLGSYVDPFTY